MRAVFTFRPKLFWHFENPPLLMHNFAAACLGLGAAASRSDRTAGVAADPIDQRMLFRNPVQHSSSPKRLSSLSSQLIKVLS